MKKKKVEGEKKKREEISVMTKRFPAYKLRYTEIWLVNAAKRSHAYGKRDITYD